MSGDGLPLSLQILGRRFAEAEVFRAARAFERELDWVAAPGFRGAEVMAGRSFTDAEDRPGGPNVVILSDAFVQRRFAGDRSIVGRTIDLDGIPFLVVGVMPRRFANVLAPHVEVHRFREIDIQKIVGATRRFIVLPLVVEAALSGALAGVMALVALTLLFQAFASRYAGGLATLDQRAYDLSIAPCHDHSHSLQPLTDLSKPRRSPE